MKERPILFGAPMVRAILDGRKTQTRRIVKPSPHADIKEFLTADPTGFWGFDGHRPVACIHCPHGEAGDQLWVREAWRIGAWNENSGEVCIDYRNGPRKAWVEIPEQNDPEGEVFRRLWEQSSDDAERAGIKYDDDGRYTWEPGQSPCRWRPSIHMPRWASRSTLEITAVRVERLNDISEADALAEGVTFQLPVKPGRADRMAREAFSDLWESINGPDSWTANPWVWVVEFKRGQP